MNFKLKNGKLIASSDETTIEMEYKGSIEKTVRNYAKLFDPDTYYDLLISYGFGWLDAIAKTVNLVETLDRLVIEAPNLKLN